MFEARLLPTSSPSAERGVPCYMVAAFLR